MPVSIIPTFLVFCLISSITPGPANINSLAAAMRYGTKAALRQWRGLLTGFLIVSTLAAVASFALGTLLNDYVGYLAWIGAAYILWLAWHMLRSSVDAKSAKADAPRFKRGVLIQLTNVKIMVYCLTALASFVLPYTHSFFVLWGVGIFLAIMGPTCNLAWLFAGASMQKLFANHRKAVDTVMAVALVFCAISLVWPH